MQFLDPLYLNGMTQRGAAERQCLVIVLKKSGRTTWIDRSQCLRKPMHRWRTALELFHDQFIRAVVEMRWGVPGGLWLHAAVT